jgi:plastocyanin
MDTEQEKSYGKKSVWRLVLIYVIIAAAVYGLVYYFFLAKRDGYNATPTEQTSMTPAASPSTDGVPPTATGSSVEIKSFQFNPSALTIKKGTVVTWTNHDSAPHTVTVDQGSGPTSSSLASGATYMYTFNTAGTFNYHCGIHPSMHGTVTVTQ